MGIANYCTSRGCFYCGDTTSIMFGSGNVAKCAKCHGLEKKVRNRDNRSKGTIQHSKPLHPKGYGYSFVPDKMVSPSCTKMTYTDGSRVSCKDDVYRRAHRKRQRRVNSYFVKLALDNFEDE